MHISAENVPCLNCQLKSELSVKPYPDPLTETLTNLSPLPPWGLTQGHLIPLIGEKIGEKNVLFTLQTRSLESLCLHLFQTYNLIAFEGEVTSKG